MGAEQSCDMHCVDSLSEAECSAVDASWDICSIDNSPWQSECRAYCDKCKSGLKPCVGENVHVAGTIETEVNIAGEAFSNNEVATSAFKKALATIAGNGVDPSDVIDVDISFNPQRRLVAMSNSSSLRTNYVIAVPSSVSDDVTQKIKSRENDEIALILNAQMAFIGKDVIFVVIEMPAPRVQARPQIGTTGAALHSQQNVQNSDTGSDISGCFRLHVVFSWVNMGFFLFGLRCLFPQV